MDILQANDPFIQLPFTLLFLVTGLRVTFIRTQEQAWTKSLSVETANYLWRLKLRHSTERQIVVLIITSVHDASPLLSLLKRLIIFCFLQHTINR